MSFLGGGGGETYLNLPAPNAGHIYDYPSRVYPTPPFKAGDLDPGLARMPPRVRDWGGGLPPDKNTIDPDYVSGWRSQRHLSILGS